MLKIKIIDSINIQCFHDAERESQNTNNGLNELNFENIYFPIIIEDIDKSESQNPYFVNVFCCNGTQVSPFRISGNGNQDNAINSR